MPPAIPNGLVEAVKRREAVLFAGAGISYPALELLAVNIKEEIGKDIQKDCPEYDVSFRTFEDVCDEYVALNDRHSLVNRLAELIDKNAAPTVNHVAAVKAFRFIVTTNWDLLFEAAYREASQGYQVLSSNGDAPNFSFDQHNLLKIHGSADRPLTLIATSEDYESYPTTHKDLLDHLTYLLNNYTILFVGYGMRDEHVRRVLTQIRLRGVWARRAYAVGFFDPVRVKLLDKRNIQAINVERPTDELASGIESFMPQLLTGAGIA